MLNRKKKPYVRPFITKTEDDLLMDEMNKSLLSNDVMLSIAEDDVLPSAKDYLQESPTIDPIQRRLCNETPSFGMRFFQAVANKFSRSASDASETPKMGW